MTNSCNETWPTAIMRLPLQKQVELWKSEDRNLHLVEREDWKRGIKKKKEGK